MTSTSWGPEWDRFVATVRADALQKIAGSEVMISIVPTGEPDIKFAVELGLGILLDKPLIVLVQPGAIISERLRRVADRVVLADIDVEDGRQAVKQALTDLGLGDAP